MKIRNLHKILGLILLLPFLGWITTALVFYIKPGYTDAYEFLQPKTYPLDEVRPVVVMDSTWYELRYVRTILGVHLIVRTNEGSLQLDPRTMQPRTKPGNEEIRKLLEDSFSKNPKRYGAVASIANDTILTTTGIRIIFDWNGLSFYQRGPDTDRIDLLYKIHYLQWTGNKTLDKILGPLGLGAVFVLSVLGVRLSIKSKRDSLVERRTSVITRDGA